MRIFWCDALPGHEYGCDIFVVVAADAERAAELVNESLSTAEGFVTANDMNECELPGEGVIIRAGYME